MLKQIILSFLKDVHAGEAHLTWNEPQAAGAPETIKLTSDDFKDGQTVPLKFAGAGVGENISPQLKWSDVPEGTRQFFLVMEDPEAPWPRPFVHLTAAGIDGEMRELPQDALSSNPGQHGITLGTGTLGRPGYQGPRAPKGLGPHRYIFQIFALNKTLDFGPAFKLSAMMPQLQGAILAKGKLTGMFEQKP